MMLIFRKNLIMIINNSEKEFGKDEEMRFFGNFEKKLLTEIRFDFCGQNLV